MTVRAVSATSVLLPVGGLWLLEVAVTDVDGYPVDDVPVVTVTLPAGTTATPTVETVTAGRYRVAYTVGTAGRYIARVVTATDAADFAAWSSTTTAGTGMPDADDVLDYLGGTGETSHDAVTVGEALDAEAAAQRAVCRVGAVYPADLREALLRRVARNLAMRRLPLAVLRGDAEGGDTILPGRDPEVRRLEAPYRKLVVG